MYLAEIVYDLANQLTYFADLNILKIHPGQLNLRGMQFRNSFSAGDCSRY